MKPCPLVVSFVREFVETGRGSTYRLAYNGAGRCHRAVRLFTVARRRIVRRSTQVGNDKSGVFAVHESEAWLLSEPDILPRTVRDVIRRQG